jgi:hypothetical protein
MLKRAQFTNELVKKLLYFLKYKNKNRKNSILHSFHKTWSRTRSFTALLATLVVP